MNSRCYYFLNFVALFALLVTKAFLLLRILRSRSCSGISANTQILYAVAFTARVLDSFKGYFYYYKPIGCYLYIYTGLVVLIITYIINISIHRSYATSYDKEYDTVKIWRLIVPCAVLTVFMSKNLIWFFSVYLETVAIIPQMQFIKNSKNAEKHVLYYMGLLIIYKIVQVMDELSNIRDDYKFDEINMACALIQVMVLIDFLMRLEKRQKIIVSNVEALTEPDSLTNNSRFNDNLKEVVLSPLLLNEKCQKSNGPVLPAVHKEKKINS